MSFPFYIAKRYFFAKKKRNAINVITFISMIGVMAVSAALIILLSVFNGFDGLIQTLFSTFDPELKVTPAMGKVFSLENEKIRNLYKHPGIEEIAEVMEENVLVTFEENQYPAIIKGVSDNFAMVTGIDSMMFDGKFILHDQNRPYAIIGQGLAYYLSYHLDLVSPLKIYVIKRTANASLNVEKLVKWEYLYASGIFRIEQDYDLKYMIVPINVTRELLEYGNEVTALELKTKNGTDISKIQQEIRDLLGEDFTVKNRYEQNEAFYKIMKTEKWAIYFILLFILIIVSFNVLGSLSMLMIDKREDIGTLQSMGASRGLIKRIFVAEGNLIALIGALAGLAFGLLICWLQIEFGLVKLKGSGSFIIDSYPVIVKIKDVVLVFSTVLVVGFLVSLFPVSYLSKKYGI